MLRIKDTDMIIDGRPIAYDIMRDKSDKNGCYSFYSLSNHYVGLGKDSIPLTNECNLD